MIAINRKAGKKEFSDPFVQSEAMQKLQRKIKTEHDPEIEKLGFDKMRSRISILLKNGQVIEGTADERYRGGPVLEGKVVACCEGILDDTEQQKLIQAVWNIKEMENICGLAELIQSDINC